MRTEEFKAKIPVPCYEDQEDQEIFLKLLREFEGAIDLHDLWTTTDEAKVYDMFQQYLGGDTLDTWVDLVVDENEAS